MNVDIYIHGVPNGQRIWGNGGDDQVINQFYGTGSEEQTKFLAEVRKSGGQNYCYYSILKYKNVSAENGRAGSYFGITIKMDMVCTKVKTVFQILEMVYNNAILGKFIKKEGERLLFLVSDFKEKENLCKAIIEKIMTMLGQSLEGNDFVSITPSMLSGKGTVKYNLAEYSSESAFASLSQYGSVAVSTDYPSTQLSSYIKKKDAELTSFRQQASQELQEQERRSNAAIQQTREQATREIEQMKAKYADIDRKIIEREREIKQLQRNIEQLQSALQERDRMIDKLHRQSGSGYAHGSSGASSSPSTMKVLTSVILPFVNLLIGIVVVVVLFWKMPSDNSKIINQISEELMEMREKMESDTISVDTTDIQSVLPPPTSTNED